MRRLITFVVLLLVILAESLPSTGQTPIPNTGLPQPRLLIVIPTGARVGSTVEVAVTGQDLDDAQGLYFSHDGFKTEVLEAPKPDKKGIATARFKITVPIDAPLGQHDVRVISKWGVSNPRTFVIGDLPETVEKEPNNDVDQAQRVELNSTVSGTISTPTDVDYFVFAGKKGQRVVVSCLASSIDSKLHAALQLYGPKETLLGFNRDYRGTDALLDATLPEDGDYHVRIFSFTYTQGGSEHFYRLTISTAPWIDAVFPPVVEPGKQTKVTVYGRNLPGGKPDAAAQLDGRVLETMTATIEVANDPVALQRLAFPGQVAPQSASLNGFAYRVKNDAGSSNAFLLTYARAPVVRDNEANDTPETAQEITLPCEIAGRIEKKRDRDWYVFSAKKGDVFSIEAFGERIGSPLNLVFSMRDAASGKLLYESADNTETLSATQFVTRTEDPPRYRFVVPADGKYHLLVTSREAFVQAGPRQLYRVRVTPERPDFQLIVMPTSVSAPDACVVGGGSYQPYTVFVWRHDGFAGDVALAADGFPAGVACPPQTIAANGKQAALVVGAAADAAAWTGSFRVTGTATINGEKVVREARPATITWPAQQNVPTIARLDRSLVLAVRDQAPFSLTIKADKDETVAGDNLKLTVKAERHWSDMKGAIQLSALSVPANMTLSQPLPMLTPGKDEATLTLDVKAAAPAGTYTVVLRGQTQVPFSRDPNAKQKQNAAVSQAGVVLVTVKSK